MSIDHQKMIDRLTPLQQAVERIKTAIGEPELSHEEISDLKFLLGATVRDKITGEEVKVLGGKRASYYIPATGGKTP